MANNKAVAKPSFFMIFTTVLLQDVYNFGTHCIVTIY